MAKTNTGGTDAGDVVLNILDKVDLNSFDEIAAMQNGGKIGNEDEGGNDDPDEEEDDDDQDEGSAGAGGVQPAGKTKGKPQSQQQTPQTIDLTDDEIIAGLQRTSGKEPAAGQTKPKPTTAKAKPAAAAAASAGDEGEGADDNQDNPNPDSPFSVHYDLMVEAGEWEPIEGFDGTKESYLKAREFNESKKIDEGINAWLEDALKNNPDGVQMGKRLLTHLANGGKVSDFVAVHSQSELDFAALEDADEAKAEAAALDILPKYYASIGWKPAQIQKKMEALNKVGGEVDEAKLIAGPYQEQITARAKQMETQQAQATAAAKQSRAAFNNTLQSTIQKGHDFGYFKIGATKKEKDELNAFFFSPEEETGVSQYSRLLNEAMKDPMFHLMIGDILKNQTYKADPAKVKKPGKAADANAIDALEDRLTKSLLNKSLSTKTADAGAGGFANSRANAGGQTREFKLEEAVVIS